MVSFAQIVWKILSLPKTSLLFIQTCNHNVFLLIGFLHQSSLLLMKLPFLPCNFANTSQLQVSVKYTFKYKLFIRFSNINHEIKSCLIFYPLYEVINLDVVLVGSMFQFNLVFVCFNYLVLV